MNGVLHQGFWRKLPPTLLRQYTPVQTTDPYQYYYTFPSISNYEYSNNYGIEGKGGKRKKVKKKENKKKRMPVGVTIRYIPPPLTINQMVSYGKFCIIIAFRGPYFDVKILWKFRPIVIC